MLQLRLFLKTKLQKKLQTQIEFFYSYFWFYDIKTKVVHTYYNLQQKMLTNLGNQFTRLTVKTISTPFAKMAAVRQGWRPQKFRFNLLPTPLTHLKNAIQNVTFQWIIEYTFTSKL